MPQDVDNDNHGPTVVPSPPSILSSPSPPPSPFGFLKTEKPTTRGATTTPPPKPVPQHETAETEELAIPNNLTFYPGMLGGEEYDFRDRRLDYATLRFSVEE